MTNKQRAAKQMRQVYLKLIPDVVERLSLLGKPISTHSVKRLASAKHVGFNLTDDVIASNIPVSSISSETVVSLSLF